MDTSFNVHFQNIQGRHNFRSADESSCAGGSGGSIRIEDYESTCSHCTSEIVSGAASITDSSAEGGSVMRNETTAMSPIADYGYQMPQGYTQRVNHKGYHGVGEYQQQQYSTFPNKQNAVRSFEHELINDERNLFNESVCRALQPRNVKCLPQIRHSIPQEDTCIRGLITAAPYLNSPSHRFISHEAQETFSVVSSIVNTPILGYKSPSCGNSFGYITPTLPLPASCGQVQRVMPLLELPPAFDLDDNKSFETTFPEQLYSKNRGGRATSTHQGCFGAHKPITRTISNAIGSQLMPLNDYLLDDQLLVEKMMSPCLEEENSIWRGSLKYEECMDTDRSNLFITWSGPKVELIKKLQNYRYEVLDVLSTSDDRICNVIFGSHPVARKVFTLQQQLRLQMVPPKNSKRNWLRNPSPNFLVNYETQCQLLVKSGKSQSNYIVGELLPGCLISADQVKGHRMRVVGCEGSFMFPGGKIAVVSDIPTKSHEKRVPLGWITYRSKITKKPFITRRSSNRLEDYIFNE